MNGDIVDFHARCQVTNSDAVRRVAMGNDDDLISLNVSVHTSWRACRRTHLVSAANKGLAENESRCLDSADFWEEEVRDHPAHAYTSILGQLHLTVLATHAMLSLGWPPPYFSSSGSAPVETISLLVDLLRTAMQRLHFRREDSRA